MIKKYLFHTNKILLKIIPQEAFRDLCIKINPTFKKQTLEQFSSLAGYYLMDRFIESGYQQEIFDRIFQDIFPEIFGDELSNKNIPVEHWPDIYDYAVFKKFFKIKQLSLTADLGAEPIKTIKTEHD